MWLEYAIGSNKMCQKDEKDLSKHSVNAKN